MDVCLIYENMDLNSLHRGAVEEDSEIKERTEFFPRTVLSALRESSYPHLGPSRQVVAQNHVLVKPLSNVILTMSQLVRRHETEGKFKDAYEVWQESTSEEAARMYCETLVSYKFDLKQALALLEPLFAFNFKCKDSSQFPIKAPYSRISEEMDLKVENELSSKISCLFSTDCAFYVKKEGEEGKIIFASSEDLRTLKMTTKPVESDEYSRVKETQIKALSIDNLARYRGSEVQILNQGDFYAYHGKALDTLLKSNVEKIFSNLYSTFPYEGLCDVPVISDIIESAVGAMERANRETKADVKVIIQTFIFNCYWMGILNHIAARVSPTTPESTDAKLPDLDYIEEKRESLQKFKEQLIKQAPFSQEIGAMIDDLMPCLSKDYLEELRDRNQQLVEKVQSIGKKTLS